MNFQIIMQFGYVFIVTTISKYDFFLCEIIVRLSQFSSVFFSFQNDAFNNKDIITQWTLCIQPKCVFFHSKSQSRFLAFCSLTLTIRRISEYDI